MRGAARLYATAGNGAIYYGLGVTEHSQGSTMVMGIANLAMATGNLGREGVGVNPLRGQNNVQGSCDMGSFPHEFSGYRHVSDAATRAAVRERTGACRCEPSRACAFPNMFEAALDGSFKGLYIQGEDLAQSDPEHAARHRGARGDGVRRRAGPVPERDGEVRARVPAGLVVPREGRHVHQRRAAHLARAQGHGAARRARGLGSHGAAVERARLSDALSRIRREIMDEIARLTPTFTGVSYEKLDRLGSIQWPCNDAAPEGTPTMHVGAVRARQGQVLRHRVRADERARRRAAIRCS